MHIVNESMLYVTRSMFFINAYLTYHIEVRYYLSIKTIIWMCVVRVSVNSKWTIQRHITLTCTCTAQLGLSLESINPAYAESKLFNANYNIAQANSSVTLNVESLDHSWIYIKSSCVFENKRESLTNWSAHLRIYTEFKPSIMKPRSSNWEITCIC